MSTRTTHRNFQFQSAFRLPGLARDNPPGVYHVTVEEEEMHGLSFVAYRTVLAHLQIPALGTTAGSIEHVPICMDDLEDCVLDDRLKVSA